ncbi:MAG TPA: hypothetical protein VMQ51_14875 [Candidatus Binatia bacterium]|nr:hypothetical protein [Candidatus Binatia bacterium]
MRLITAHRILILAGIAFFIFYAVVRGRHYLADGATMDLVQTIVALAVALALQWYFRSLSRWGQR